MSVSTGHVNSIDVPSIPLGNIEIIGCGGFIGGNHTFTPEISGLLPEPVIWGCERATR